MHTLFQPEDPGFVITDTGRLIYKVFEQRSAALGYSKYHCQILANLNQTPGTMQAALANQMEIEPITLSRHLDRMESEGVVERKSDMKDRRVKRLYLTAKAQEQLQELMGIRDEIVRTIYHHVDLDEARRIREMFLQIRRNLMEMLK